MTQTIEQLTARVRELEEEKKELQALLDFDNARLDQIEDELEDVEYLGPFVEGIKVLKTRLAAEQLNNKLLRKALKAVIKVHGYESGIPVEAISTKASTEALDKYVAEKVKEAVKEADDQILAAKNLLAIMHRDGGHHEFAVGFDQAIQDAMAVYYELTRQRDLAVDAMRVAAEQIRKCDYTPARSTLLVAIKESEGK